VIGVGLGAVIGLEIALAEPRAVRSVALVEPPLFGLLPEATAGLSADVEAIADAVRAGGEREAYDLFLAGGLNCIGPGAERLGQLADQGPRAPRSLLVEIPAVPEWPLDRTRFERLEASLAVVTLGSTPALLARAADRFTAWLDEGEIGAEQLAIDESDPSLAVASLISPQ
jgi:pimeloyl-ACP methyl ester carboxylesterase